MPISEVVARTLWVPLAIAVASIEVIIFLNSAENLLYLYPKLKLAPRTFWVSTAIAVPLAIPPIEAISVSQAQMTLWVSIAVAVALSLP